MKVDFSNIFLSKGLNYYADYIPLSAILKYLKIYSDESLHNLGRFILEDLVEVSAIGDHYSMLVVHTWSITD
jgi:acyl-CoA dehydrogenase